MTLLRHAVLASAFFVLASAACVAAATADADPMPPGIPAAAAARWQLVWRDEFDGTVLDETKWSHRYLGPRESAMIAKDCISLDGHGLLHVWVKEKDGVLQNGMIGTQGKFAAKFGIIAARIKFPEHQGQHGSLWMQPAQREKGSGDAARGGAEIDVVEWFGAYRRDTGTASNVYWGTDTERKKNRVGQFADVSRILKPGELTSDDFHVFSVEWSEEGYIFRMDGHETLRTTEGVSHQPQYLILSLLTADWEAGRLDRTKLPNSMQVDWVRVWQKSPAPAPAPANRLIAPDDSNIAYSDHVHMEFVPSPVDPSAKLARFDRVLDVALKGYRWDNPGARIRFRTNSTRVKALLYFNELHISTSARNSSGLYLIDGASKPEWIFHTKAVQPKREPESVVVTMAEGGAAGFHDYELILPYGDSVDFRGVEVDPEARFEAPPARPATRYLAYGDSITHGFTASAVDKSYAFLVAQKNGWQLVNLGLGGRASNVADAKVVASLQADVISVLMGVNDWQGGGPLERYRSNMMGFLDVIRAAQPSVPIYYLTPLWVAPSWNPKGQVADLESYRQVAREIVAARKDPHLHLVEGPALIDHDAALFDAVAVHPNDQGFAQMAERLADQMRQPSK